MTDKQTQKLFCPKCRHPVVKGGAMHGFQRYRCVKHHRGTGCGWNGTRPIGLDPAKDPGIDHTETARVRARIVSRGASGRYVITAAQNATPIHKPFWQSLQTYARQNNAEIVVIPYRYKNPTSRWSATAESEDWWAPEVVPHLMDRRVAVHKHLTLLGDIKTQPTATAPTQGFESLAGSSSAIIGHPKIELVTVPTPQSSLPKILTTTGAVTVKNYIPSKAGKKGEFHHSFGAAVVELSGSAFHLRQLNALPDGSFIDLRTEYDGTATRDHRIEALAMGDTHEEFVDPDVVRATFEGPDSIVSVLQPKVLIWNDLHDFTVRNHHDRGEIFRNYVKHHTGHDNVEAALRATFDFVDRVTPPGVVNVFVPSNHPDAFARWVKETDPRTDLENCVFWAQTFEAMCRESRWTDVGPTTIDPFAYWGMKWLKCAKRCRFLQRGESFAVKGIECGFHGDKGSNGARGSLKGYAKIGVKTITGHGHAPGIFEGAYRIGTNSRLNLPYAAGAPSSWMHTDCVVYGNGKRSLLNIIKGHWRG